MDFDEILQQLNFPSATVNHREQTTREYSGATWFSDLSSFDLAAPDSLCFGLVSQFNVAPDSCRHQTTFILYSDAPLEVDIKHCTVVTINNKRDFRSCYERVSTEFRRLRRIIDASYSLMALVSSGTGLKRLVNEVSRIFEMPVSVLDRSLSFLAYSDGFPFYAARGEEQMSGLLPDDAQRLMKTIGLINPQGDIYTPRVFTWKDDSGSTFTNHFAFISIGRTILGSVSFFSEGEPLRKSRLKILPVIAQIMSVELQKNSTFLLNKSLYYSHLLDMVIGGSVVDSSARDRFSAFGYSLKDYRFLVFADTSHEYFDGSQIQTIARRLQNAIHNSIYVIHPNDITVFSSCESPKISDVVDLPALKEIVADTTIEIGISGPFPYLSTARAFLKQAQQAIATGLQYHPHEQIFYFADYRLADMLTQVSDQQALYSYQYPPLLALLDYDLTHGGHLAYTLFVYLLDIENPRVAYERLGIHKNTLYYRLGKIEDIMQVDVKASLTITQIQITFLILRHQGKLFRMVPELETSDGKSMLALWDWR